MGERERGEEGEESKREEGEKSKRGRLIDIHLVGHERDIEVHNVVGVRELHLAPGVLLNSILEI